MTKQFVMGSLISKAVMVVISAGVIWFGVTLLTEPVRAEEGGTTVTVEAKADGRALGMKYISAALAVGIGSVAAGIAVAMVGSAAMGAVAERPELMGRSLIYVGLAEGIAIYGVVVAIMILLG
ncbi:MAG: ATP synthase subunit C [bacterium]|nr:ATP synthase subunit C [bacterium]